MQLIKENSLVLLLILGTAFACFWLVKRREDLNIKWWDAIILGVLHTMIGLLFVKIFAVLETFDFSKAGSMSLFGGVFFMPILYILGAKLFKRNIGMVTDIFTPCMIFTVMCARVNCIISGCCLGAYIPGMDGWRYPTREAEIIFYILLLSYFMFWKKKNEVVGTRYPLYMAAYGTFRFVCEFFRESDSEILFHLSHLWAVVAVIVGISFYTELKSRQRKNKYKDNHHF